MPKQIDWIKIKSEYVNTKISYRELAEKYNVSLQSVSKHGNAEKWGELRKKQLNKISTEVVQKTAEKIVEYEVDRISHIMHMCDKLTKEIDKAIEQLDKVIVNGEVVNVGLIDTYKLRQLVQSLKDVKDIVKTDTSERDLKQLDTVIEHIKGNI